MRKSRIVVLVLVLAGVFWYFSHSTKETDTAKSSGRKGNAIVPVSVATAKTGDIDVYLSGLGNIAPRNIATVHSRVDGQVMKILFQEGQLVKEGDLLMELDARPFEAQLEQAEGLMVRDRALLAEAKIDLQRYQTLYAQDSIAKQQLDTQVSLVKQYEGAVKNDKGQVDNARLQLDYTRITSPFNGQVGLRQVDLGNIVHATDANGVAIVTQLQPITAIFTLPEDTIPVLIKRQQTGEKIVAEAWDREDRTRIATGTLLAMDNQIDQTTGTLKLKAEFSNADNSLFASQFVNIRCRIDTRKNVVIIPVAAIQRGSQGTFVYLLKGDNTVNVQPVTIDVTQGDNASIAKGIAAGDVVITDGVDNLRDGAKVEIAGKPSDKDEKSGKPDTKDGADGKEKHEGEKGKHHKKHDG